MNRKKVIDKLAVEFATHLKKFPDEGLKALAEGKLVLKLDKAVEGESGGSISDWSSVSTTFTPIDSSSGSSENLTSGTFFTLGGPTSGGW
jgi:hypothetical protein